MRGDREPVRPRHTFDDDSSSDDDQADPDPTRSHIEDYSERSDDLPPRPANSIVTSDDIRITLLENIRPTPRVLIAFGLLCLAKNWFGPHKEVGSVIGLQNGEPATKITYQILYHEEQDVYTLGFSDIPGPAYWGRLACRLLQVMEPSRLVLLGSPSSIPSSDPITMLRTTAATFQSLPGVLADPNPVHSNRRRVSPEDIQARISAHRHPLQSDDIPLLLPPKMVEGFEASFCWWAEICGIPALYFAVSLHIGENLEKTDLRKIVKKVDDFLERTVTDAEMDLVVNHWHATYRHKVMGEGFYI